VVTVGSFQAGAKHNIISDEAKLQLTVRSYTPEVRKLLLDGIGGSRAARRSRPACPRTRCRGEIESAVDLQHREIVGAMLNELFGSSHFGAARVVEDQADDGGEDFSRFWLADKSKQS
jgi:metal-dependent amidase/aminoacylase/carboxypeptidase family protein